MREPEHDRRCERGEPAVNQAEKEKYLREYSILKNEGKPFFP